MNKGENNRRILLFHVGKEKEKQIKVLCDRLNIQPVVIPRKEYGESLGTLAGIVGMKRSGKQYEGTEFPTEMMVFSGIPSEELDVFLEKYREADIEKISLKAMMTPYNVLWTPGQIYAELVKEHMSFLNL